MVSLRRRDAYAEPIRDDTEYDGLRVRVRAMLGNARIEMQIDIGFGNAIEPPAKTCSTRGCSMLRFRISGPIRAKLS